MTSDPKRMLLESLWLPVGSRPCGSNKVMLGALGCCIHSMVHCLLLQILNIAIVIKIVGTCKKCVAFSCVDSFRVLAYHFSKMASAFRHADPALPQSLKPVATIKANISAVELVHEPLI